jgi:hypothetical protein
MKRGLVLLLIVALLAVPLALALRDISQMMFTELMRLVWMIRRQLEGLPQATLWGLLLVIVLVATVGSLFGWSQTTPGTARESARVPGQIRELSRWIRRSAERRYFRWTLSRYMTNLTWDVMAYREGTTPREIRRRVRAGETELPPAIRDFVEASGSLRAPAPRSLRHLLRRRRPEATAYSGAKQPGGGPVLEDLVRFLEEQMEVEHDRGTG